MTTVFIPSCLGASCRPGYPEPRGSVGLWPGPSSFFLSTKLPTTQPQFTKKTCGLCKLHHQPLPDSQSQAQAWEIFLDSLHNPWGTHKGLLGNIMTAVWGWQTLSSLPPWDWNIHGTKSRQAKSDLSLVSPSLPGNCLRHQPNAQHRVRWIWLCRSGTQSGCTPYSQPQGAGPPWEGQHHRSLCLE